MAAFRRTDDRGRRTDQNKPPILSVLCPLSSVLRHLSSYPLVIKDRLLAAAVAAQCAFGTDRAGALEDPVLPGGETRENLRFHGLRAGEAQIGFEAGQGIGREARPLLQEHAHLVAPIDVVAREGDEAEPLRRLG